MPSRSSSHTGGSGTTVRRALPAGRRSDGLAAAWCAGAALALACLLPTASLDAFPQAPPTADLVALAARYADNFPRAASGVVMEERYQQQLRMTTMTTREIRSDLMIVATGASGWLDFRDVFEVDGKPVRDRTDRLLQIFAQPDGRASEQAARIVAEGARFNLDPVIKGRRVSRTINSPTLALAFLRSANLARSSFIRQGSATIDGVRATVVEFRERSRPRLIATNVDAAAHGTFWIDPATGAVLRSELQLNNGREEIQVASQIRVDYARAPYEGLWLPRAMDEHYEISTDSAADLPPARTPLQSDGLAPANIVVEGQAAYAKIRRFSVGVSEQVQ